ncbi:mycofactocin system transcriptional regulator [Nocardia jejuensis]|uniref:mycofactocin system transcriptional regulator n=1 Tax=Nocardia jejuensis TaxID=328049 RepID=UPI0008379761|nr:mycofactocin system transcriptional regulator [Nocardia jejuensis]
MTSTIRRGRPPGTSGRRLELVALGLFSEQGFEHTTVDQIAAAVGVSRRTFFRYFDSKPDVLWHGFEREVAAIRAALAQTTPEAGIMTSIRRAVMAVNHTRTQDEPELRQRIRLLTSTPDLIASAALRYDTWERAISDFVAARTGQPADSIHPLTVGRATLAACRAAYECWIQQYEIPLTTYLESALRALESGFADDAIGG